MPCHTLRTHEDISMATLRRLQLADGRRVWLRPLRPSDGPKLIELGQRLSADTIWRRFLRSTRCTAEQIGDLVAVDQIKRVAIAAVAAPTGDAAIVGVGRFHGDDGQRAEIALLVEDAYQRQGLGRLLLRRLLDEARQRRLRELFGYVLYNNTPMLGLLRSSGQPLEIAWHGGDLLEIQLSLTS
jgi:acetyltransferase